MTYLVVGTEKGDSGTPHYQGYVCFAKRLRLTGVKKIIPNAHLSIKYKKSTPEEAADYCKKDGLWTEHGILPLTPEQGTKRKWEEAYELAKAHQLEKISKKMLVPYYHSFKRIQQDNPRKLANLDTTCGVWIVGPTGIGKSKLAREKYPDYYDKPLNKWWDGYRDQPYAILDDVGPDQGKWIGGLMKRWTDHYPFPAEQKGTTIQIRPKNVIVTSQYTIEEVFSNTENGMDMPLIDALNRRFEIIKLPLAKKPCLNRQDAEFFDLVEDFEQKAIAGEPTVHTVLRPNLIDLTESDEEIIIPETQDIPTKEDYDSMDDFDMDFYK